MCMQFLCSLKLRLLCNQLNLDSEELDLRRHRIASWEELKFTNRGLIKKLWEEKRELKVDTQSATWMKPGQRVKKSPTEDSRNEVYELQIEKQPLTRSNNQLRGNESNMKTYSFDYLKAYKNTKKTNSLIQNARLRIKNYKPNLCLLMSQNPEF